MNHRLCTPDDFPTHLHTVMSYLDPARGWVSNQDRLMCREMLLCVLNSSNQPDPSSHALMSGLAGAQSVPTELFPSTTPAKPSGITELATGDPNGVGQNPDLVEDDVAGRAFQGEGSL